MHTDGHLQEDNKTKPTKKLTPTPRGGADAARSTGSVLSRVCKVLAIVLPLFFISACAELDTQSEDDVHDIGSDDSLQSLSSCTETTRSVKSQVCEGKHTKQLTGINRKCFKTTLSSTYCAQCRLISIQKGATGVFRTADRDADGKIRYDAAGKTITKIVRDEKDGCCFKAPAGKYPGQPLWLPSEDPDCPVIDCRDPLTWPAEWAYKEEKILAALNKQRAQDDVTCTKYKKECDDDGKNCIDVKVCETETLDQAPRLVFNDKLRIAARCHAVEQARSRFMSHDGAPITTVSQGKSYTRPSTYLDRIKAEGYEYGSSERMLTVNGKENKWSINNASEILRYWTKDERRTAAEEMDFVIGGFMSSYYHCLPLMSNFESLGDDKASCGTMDAPFRHVGIGVVDVGEFDKNKTILSGKSMWDNAYQATIKFGSPK